MSSSAAGWDDVTQGLSSEHGVPLHVKRSNHGCPTYVGMQVYALLMRVPGIGIAKESNTGEQRQARQPATQHLSCPLHPFLCTLVHDFVILNMLGTRLSCALRKSLTT